MGGCLSSLSAIGRIQTQLGCRLGYVTAPPRLIAGSSLVASSLHSQARQGVQLRANQGASPPCRPIQQ